MHAVNEMNPITQTVCVATGTVDLSAKASISAGGLRVAHEVPGVVVLSA